MASDGNSGHCHRITLPAASRSAVPACVHQAFRCAPVHLRAYKPAFTFSPRNLSRLHIRCKTNVSSLWRLLTQPPFPADCPDGQMIPPGLEPGPLSGFPTDVLPVIRENLILLPYVTHRRPKKKKLRSEDSLRCAFYGPLYGRSRAPDGFHMKDACYTGPIFCSCMYYSATTI